MEIFIFQKPINNPPHALKDKTRNKTSSSNHHTIMGDDLDSPTLLPRTHGKVALALCNYVVQSKLQTKCSWFTFKKIMISNLIVSPWARSEFKKVNNKLWKPTIENVPKHKLHKQMQMMIDCNQKGYLRKPRPEDEGEIGVSDASQDYWIDNSYLHFHARDDSLVKKLKTLDLGKKHQLIIMIKSLKSCLNKGQCHNYSRVLAGWIL